MYPGPLELGADTKEESVSKSSLSVSHVVNLATVWAGEVGIWLALEWNA